MSTLLIQIDLNHAAFEGDPRAEVARILHELADDIETANTDDPGATYTLHHGNGDTVGMLSIG